MCRRDGPPHFYFSFVCLSSACLEGRDDVPAGLIRSSVGGLSALHPYVCDGRRE